MRITECMFLIVVVLLLGGRVGNMITKNIKSSENLAQQIKNTQSIEFIPESFRNTVHGSGFENLTEWKLVCSEMYSLDDIQISKNDGLVIGTWVGPMGSGIVYELEDK
ncbi:MAG: hypothetical protein MJ182_04430 [Treponema sp.]|nr:hypothetical protein [Treponema sp.]